MNVRAVHHVALSLAVSACLSSALASAQETGLSSDEPAVAAAITAIVESTVLSPPIRLGGYWMVSRAPEVTLGTQVDQEVLLDAYRGSDRRFVPLLSECAVSLRERTDGNASAISDLPSRIMRFVELVDTQNPMDKCDASNTYAEDLFEAYILDGSPHDSLTGPWAQSSTSETEQGFECWGSMTVSLPGYCGDQREVALVVLEISQAVPHPILRAPYTAAVLLWREDGEWVARAVRTFGSTDWSHEQPLERDRPAEEEQAALPPESIAQARQEMEDARRELEEQVRREREEVPKREDTLPGGKVRELAREEMEEALLLCRAARLRFVEAEVELDPVGEVRSVELRTGSGEQGCDLAVIRALQASSWVSCQDLGEPAPCRVSYALSLGSSLHQR